MDSTDRLGINAVLEHETVNPVPEVAVSSKWDKFTDLQRHF